MYYVYQLLLGKKTEFEYCHISFMLARFITIIRNNNKYMLNTKR